METIDIKGFHAISEFIEKATCFSSYRGVSHSTFGLIPSIGRYENYSLNMERHVFSEFKRMAYPYFAKEAESDWDWLFLAQHYGLPTRLLDWTENPFAALFFASLGESKEDFVVYAIREGIYSGYEQKSDPFRCRDTFFLRPPHVDRRISAQHGFFSVHSNPAEPWKPKDLVRFRFPGSRREDLHAELRMLGVSQRVLFPDVGGVVEDIKYSIDGICG